MSPASSAATRLALSEATVEVLASEGFGGTTAKAIAARSGCRESLIFYHFGSVTALVIEAVQELSNRRLADLGEALRDATTPEALVEIVREAIADDLRKGDLKVLLATLEGARREPTIASALTGLLRPWEALATRTFQWQAQVHPLGVFVPAPLVAKLVLAGLVGLELLGSVHEDTDVPMVLDQVAMLMQLGLSLLGEPVDEALD